MRTLEQARDLYSPTSGFPLLDNGYHLSLGEFERRYALLPNLKRAELIEGFVHLMASPVSGWHAAPHSLMTTLIGRYKAESQMLYLANDLSVRLDAENEVQPDVLLRIIEIAGGQSKLTEKLLEGPPELVVEISVSSVAIDMNSKFHIYRRNGVREYGVWQVEDEKIVWFAWEGGSYVALPEQGGIIKSKVFPGLWINTGALLGEDLGAALKTLEDGLKSAEFLEFKSRLEAARK